MKKPLILLLLIAMLSACNTDDDNNKTVIVNNNPIIGKWKLVEQLMDPGDGSGLFIEVDSDKTLDFYLDGTVSSNGNLCNQSTNTLIGTVGTFNEIQHITPSACSVSLGIEYELLTETSLIIRYPCIDSCLDKFEKFK